MGSQQTKVENVDADVADFIGKTFENVGQIIQKTTQKDAIINNTSHISTTNASIQIDNNENIKINTKNPLNSIIINGSKCIPCDELKLLGKYNDEEFMSTYNKYC